VCLEASKALRLQGMVRDVIAYDAFISAFIEDTQPELTVFEAIRPYGRCSIQLLQFIGQCMREG